MTSDSFGRNSPTSRHLWGRWNQQNIIDTSCDHRKVQKWTFDHSATWIFIESEIPKGPKNGVVTTENINNARNINFVSCHYLEVKRKQKNWIESQETNISKGSGESQVGNHANNEEEEWMKKYSNHPLWDSRFFSPVRDSSAFFFHKWFSVFLSLLFIEIHSGECLIKSPIK